MSTSGSREGLDEALLRASIGIARVGLDGRILVANDAYCRILGREREAILLRSPAEFSHPADVERSRAAVERLASGAASSVEDEKRYLRPDGSTAWCRLSVSLVHDGEGRPLHHLSHIVDITPQKEAEQALRESEGDLLTLLRLGVELQEAEDVRTSACQAAADLTGADIVLLFERHGGELVSTRALGDPTGEQTRVALAGSEPSGAVSAYLSARPIFVENAPSNPVISQRVTRDRGIESVFFQPVVVGGRSVAVLAVIWQWRLDGLARRVATMMGHLAQQAACALERESLLQRLSDEASLDPLTGIPNRRALAHRLGLELAAAAAGRGPVVLAILDLDRFKAFNDEHGHVAGDRLLAAAAASWRREIRAGDFLARYGGEEFVIVLSDCTWAVATAVLERVRRATPDGQTCSVGAARWDGAESADSLLRRADAALYRAKEQGRDRLELDCPA